MDDEFGLRRERIDASGRFAILDGLRGVGAVAVVLTHAEGLFGHRVTPSGYLAVDLFFVLSGFVLAHAYDRPGLRMAEFLRLRLIRLYPLYALGLLVAVTVATWQLSMRLAPWSWRQISLSAICGAVMIPTPLRGFLYPLNRPAWSLFLELLANAAFCTWLIRRPRGLALAAVLSAIGLCIATARYGHLSDGPGWHDVWVGLARVGWSFPVGVALHRYAPRLSLPVWCAPVLLGSVAAAMAIPLGWGVLPAVLVGAPLAIWLGSCIEPGFLAVPCRVLGRMSYPLYALHWPLIPVAAYLGGRFGVPGPMLGAAFLLAAGGLALLAERFYDRPVRAFLHAQASQSSRFIPMRLSTARS